ncbi:hypothetical protein EV183_001018 [Coemansia sp. RSA 2336]|nr:hypothetical protein EV183_001018 [Coemansia sp. RSA 2336]
MLCLICLDSILCTQDADGQALHPATLHCGHLFHKECINEWFVTACRLNCPICHKVQYTEPIALFMDAEENGESIYPEPTAVSLQRNYEGVLRDCRNLKRRCEVLSARIVKHKYNCLKYREKYQALQNGHTKITVSPDRTWR